MNLNTFNFSKAITEFRMNCQQNNKKSKNVGNPKWNFHKYGSYWEEKFYARHESDDDIEIKYQV